MTTTREVIVPRLEHARLWALAEPILRQSRYDRRNRRRIQPEEADWAMSEYLAVAGLQAEVLAAANYKIVRPGASRLAWMSARTCCANGWGHYFRLSGAGREIVLRGLRRSACHP